MNKLLKSLLAAVVISAISVKTVNVYAEESEEGTRQGPVVSSEVQAEIDALLEQVYYNDKLSEPIWFEYRAVETSLQQALEKLIVAESTLNEARAANDLSHITEIKAMVESELRKNKEALEKLTAELERYNTERTEAELATAEENYATAKSEYDSLLVSYNELKQEINYYDQLQTDLALKILALQGIDGRTGTMSDEIYEKMNGKQNESNTETTKLEEVVAEQNVEPVMKEIAEEVHEDTFPVTFTESTVDHTLKLNELPERTNHPSTAVDFSALSFAVLAGVGIYMARKKH